MKTAREKELREKLLASWTGKSRCGMTLLLVGLIFCCGGCEYFKEAWEAEMEYASEDPVSDEYKPRFTIGFFSIVRYPRTSKLEKEVMAPDGTTFWVNTNQLFDSRKIRDAKIVPRPGDPDLCDLQLRLDKNGKNYWQMLVAKANGEPVAMLVDSRLVGTFVPAMPKNKKKLEWVTVRIGMDSYTAKGVVRYAKKNYQYYNPKASDWFNFL